MVEHGAAPIQQLATPHLYNLTVNPDENTPYNVAQMHSRVLHRVFGPKLAEFRRSLQGDAVPRFAPVDFNPKASPNA
jgi:arylsulfatase